MSNQVAQTDLKEHLTLKNNFLSSKILTGQNNHDDWDS